MYFNKLHFEDRMNYLFAKTPIVSLYNYFLILLQDSDKLGELDLDPIIDDGVTPLDVPIEHIIRHKDYL